MKNRISKLNEAQFNGLLARYYMHMEGRGYCMRIEDAIERNKFFFLPGQRAIGESVLECLFMKKSARIVISVVRQYGKTSLVVSTMAFAYQEYYKCFGEPLKGCVVAPEKGTASEVFRRLSAEMHETSIELSVDNKMYKETVRGDSVELMSIHPDTRGSILEGRTNSFLIRDESAYGSDSRYVSDILPTMFRREGPELLISNGAYEECYYSRAVKRGNDEKNRVFRYTYNELKPQMEELARKGLHSAKVWINRIEEYIENVGGHESLEVRKNIHLELMTGTNTEDFVTEYDMDSCESCSWRRGINRGIFVGFDVASIGDRSIATFITDQKEVIDLLVIRDVGEYMTIMAQCEKLYKYCKEKGYLDSMLGIGVDATGMGIGAYEYILEIFETEVMKYTFTARTKHEWYTTFRELVRTKIKSDKITFNKSHENYKDLKEECLNLVVESGKMGNYLSFNAPNKSGYYDDYVAASCIALDMSCNSSGVYKSISGGESVEYVGECAALINREPSSAMKKHLKRQGLLKSKHGIGSTASFVDRYASGHSF